MTADFETPLHEALRLIDEEAFENADILFITDGYCDISDSLAEKLQNGVSDARCSVIGLLMDQDSPGEAFSLERFCERVLRMSQASHMDIEQQLFNHNVP